MFSLQIVSGLSIESLVTDLDLQTKLQAVPSAGSV